MNPGYAGRSNLPDNLKKLFRSVAMTKPDKELITQVMLYSQGFQTAKKLATRIVPFFDECLRDLSQQTHYDFGLRALKSVLVTSGNLKRARYQEGFVETNVSEGQESLEAKLILQALHETVAPKLVGADVRKLSKYLALYLTMLIIRIEEHAFPGVAYEPARLVELVEKLKAVAASQHLVISDLWITKILQLYQIQSIHHGVMMVGSSGSGKSTGWRILLEALAKVDGIEGVSYVIDPKVMSKDALYGTLDSTTREWTDGLFTQVLRKIIDNVRGEGEKRHWIIFDGDVDPIWVENLNR
jgi:dynein heavy chain 1, cytosolic